MAAPRALEEDSLSCEEQADWDARGGGLSPSAGVAASPAPGQRDDDDSDGDTASQSDNEEEPCPDGELWARALADEAQLLPDAGYTRVQPVVDARARELTVDWLLAVRGARRAARGLRTRAGAR